MFRCGIRPEGVRPARRSAALAMSFIFACATFAGPLTQPAKADETARLSNLLLLEQLVDVDTTQTITHQVVCSSVPIVDGSGRFVGLGHPCVHGIEVDPLARPFVVTPTSNVLAALALNSLVRLAFRGRNKRLLRLGVEIYPAVVLTNVETGYSIGHFVPSAPLRPVPRH